MNKLTNKQIQSILELKTSGLSQCAIAVKFNISQPMVSYLFAGKYTTRKEFTLEETFWKHVKQASKTLCWFWEGARNGYGYGQFIFKGKKYSAHRFSAKLSGLSIKNKVVRHTCDNPACVNPNHLLVGTHADNVADKVRRNRQARGVTNGRAKLTEKQVKFIRKSKLTNSQLAKKFNVNSRAILAIRKRETWRHVI
jgi:transcriptional regulator